MSLNNEIIRKKLFFINQPLKFYMGNEFQRKEYCFWCNKIENHGGLVYDTIDENTINLTKNDESNINDDNYLWHDCQFIDDCIENGALINIKHYRITKRPNVQKDNQNETPASTLSSSPPRKKYKSSKDSLILTDEKLKMNTAVQLEPIDILDEYKSKDEGNKTIITSTNVNHNETNQLNLSTNETPGYTKGIKVVNMETLLDSRYKLFKSPDDKSKSTENSPNEKSVDDSNGTSDKSLQKKINNKSVEELSSNEMESELLMDNLPVINDSTNDSRSLKKLSTNKNSSSILTNVKNQNCEKKNKNKFSERKLLGLKVREVSMPTSSDDDEESISSSKENDKLNLKQEALITHDYDRSVIVISDDDDDDDDVDVIVDVDNKKSSSPLNNRPHNKCYFNTVYADIERKPK